MRAGHSSWYGGVNTVRSTLALPFLAWLTIGAACQKRMPASAEKNQRPSVDRRIEKLRDLIVLPALPTDVWFEQLTLGTPGGLGPNDYLLIAVMRIKDRAQRRPGFPPRITAFANRSWLPEPVKAAVRPYDNHSVTIRGEEFDASPFAKSPFLSGTSSVVEGGEYVVLVMGTS
jgi:hypothetical protein